MKHFILLILFISTLIPYTIGQNFIIHKGDTINRIDQHNYKQGKWILFDDENSTIIEEGNFKNNQKEGKWIGYYPDGKIKHNITFKNNIANGPAKFYYKDGRLSEEGNWQNDHWTNNYKYYHPNGQLAYDWNYNESGKRTGEQKYFFDNGQIKFKGNWKNGKNDGPLNVYDSKGNLTEKRIYADGKYAKTVAQDPPAPITEPKNKLKKEHAQFKETGKRIIFNDQGRIGQNGYFIDGNLYNGEEYYYNDQGLLMHKIIFENGQQVDTIYIKR